MMNTKNFRLLLVLLLAGSIFTACKKDDDKQEVIAGFTFTVDENDFRKVTFTNTSQNYESLSWNFGDNSTPSTEVNPVHIYQTMGTFTVTLTASGSDGSKDQFT
ncbi:MAG TPA: carbohydrate-binding protein, partial [Bacteroidales bacterium]|nr:carbohydrate-binding protein [Bacteroidales bacterium]